MKNSKFQIYTGDGKGKTTAAIGLAIRASGYNKKIYFISLLKHQLTGEEKVFKKQKNITFKKFGIKEFIINNKVTPKHVKEINKAEKYIKKIIDSKEIDLLILDEMNIVNYYNLISLEKTKDIIKKCKLKNIELIFTGRNASKEIIKIADLVTEMKLKKHYFLDTPARKSIEY